MHKIMNGIICVNKEKGCTSFSVIKKLKHILKVKKIGHGGTLDPIATGVLPIFLGKATKASGFILDENKAYISELKLGITTDTQDISGNVLHSSSLKIKKSEFINVLPKFTGKIAQIPPMYSAIKINGRRLYDIARSGGSVKRDPREVNIIKLELIDFDEQNQTAKIEVYCSKGTYIRTLCNDIGESLGCGATLTDLIRTKTSVFNIDESFTLSQISDLYRQNKMKDFIIDIDKLFEKFPYINMDQISVNKLLNGARVGISEVSLSEGVDEYRIYGPEGQFIGLGKFDINSGTLKMFKIFV